MFSIVEQALGSVVRSRCAGTVPNALMRGFAKTKSVANKHVKSVGSNTRLILRISETIGKMVDRAVDEYRLLDTE